MQEYQREYGRAHDKSVELQGELESVRARSAAVEACWDLVRRSGSVAAEASQLVEEVRARFPLAVNGHGHGGASTPCESASESVAFYLAHVPPADAHERGVTEVLTAALNARAADTRTLLARLSNSEPSTSLAGQETEALRAKCQALAEEVRARAHSQPLSAPVARISRSAAVAARRAALGPDRARAYAQRSHAGREAGGPTGLEDGRRGGAEEGGQGVGASDAGGHARAPTFASARHAGRFVGGQSRRARGSPAARRLASDRARQPARRSTASRAPARRPAHPSACDVPRCVADATARGRA